MEPKQAYEILRSKANLENNVKQALLEVIKTDPKYAFYYAKDVIKGRCRELEPYFKTDPYYAYWYAKCIIEGRWPEAEEYIKTDPYSACRYAYYVIKGRFPEAEEYIKKDPKCRSDIIGYPGYVAEEYAVYVIKDGNFWENQAALEEFMNNVPKPKSNNELDALKKQREELDNKIKQLECA